MEYEKQGRAELAISPAWSAASLMRTETPSRTPHGTGFSGNLDISPCWVTEAVWEYALAAKQTHLLRTPPILRATTLAKTGRTALAPPIRSHVHPSSDAEGWLPYIDIFGSARRWRFWSIINGASLPQLALAWRNLHVERRGSGEA
jgi:hypothetical protein